MKDDLEKSIEELRAERESLRREHEELELQVESVLKKLSSNTGDTMVSWEDFKGIPINQMYPVNEKVVVFKYHQTDSVMKFNTYVKSGGTFGMHDHDVDEDVYVIKGNLVEETRGDKKYLKGSHIFYPAYELHKPKTDPNDDVISEYDVVFTKKSKV